VHRAECGSAPAEVDARRGESARQALIDAGVDLFGRLGPDGATTRDIAAAARQNVAAIPYYFGSKDGLYRAVVQFLLDRALQRNLGLIEETEALLQDARATPAALLKALARVTRGYLAILTRDDTLALARIITREQLDPTAAFDLFYVGAISRVHRCLAGLLDRYSGLDPQADPVASVLRAHLLFGSMLGFRVAGTTAMRRAGWSELGADELERIVRVACEHSEIYARGLRAQARRSHAAAARRAPMAPRRR